MADFLADLAPRVAGELRTDTYSRLLYSTDASIYQVMPHAVFIPRNAEDVQAAVTLAAERAIPIVPRTAGSSLAGQAIGEALIIDFSRHLDAILELNREESWVRVQPGIVLDELNLYLKPHGLQFGPDSGQQQPRRDGRHRRQQFHRLALHPLRHDRRPRAGAGDVSQ